MRQGKGQAVQEYPQTNTKQRVPQAIILGIPIEEHQSLMKDLSPLARGHHFPATNNQGSPTER